MRMQLAYEAFLKSIKTFPYAQHNFAGLARTIPPAQLFDGVPAVKQLSALVDRTTYLATCELFQPPVTISALSWYSQEVDGEQKCVVGALIERQIASLEESRWKPGVRDVLRVLLDDALLVYDPEERPIRHARVVLKRLELSCHSNTEAGPSEPAGKLAADAETLLTRQVRPMVGTRSTTELLTRPIPLPFLFCVFFARQDLALDAPLARFRSELLATLHLWRAVYAHRRREKALVPTVVAHAEEACRALRAMVPAAPAGANAALRLSQGLTKMQVVEPPKRTTRGGVKAAPRSRVVATRVKAPPVTPRKRRGE